MRVTDGSRRRSASVKAERALDQAVQQEPPARGIDRGNAVVVPLELEIGRA